ncbi:hypothetical protein LAZ67_14001985 [Cordylochernes scorpioides]|uniref:Transposase Tc1-like domain-containing protein n=1 Tax=Cordylochernes scorpioides TaxID=51811 RepID=A0ABY6L935_9ARAC|nr:hypothetical protein LAZ67_14001985 [Cordylochernes scorpioides]
MSGHRKRRQFKQTDAFTRGMVIGLKRAGWSIRQIAADTHLGASTVHRLWRRWLEQGNVAIYRNVGATRVTSARVDRRILRQAVAAPQATCTAILQHVQDTLDHSISTRTISRRLVANGLHSCRPLRRLPLTPPKRRQRLEWCRARSTWMTEWHRVVFSESRFCLSSDSRRVRVWRRRGERSNPAAIVERPTVRQRGIMVWGAIAYDSRSPLLRIQGTMTAQRYVDDVLRPVTLPYLQGVPNALYQQDNADRTLLALANKLCKMYRCFPGHRTLLISPIEHVWDIIGRRLHALSQPRSEDELWQMVEREWRAIPQDAIRTLIDSLPRRVAACIAVRGLHVHQKAIHGIETSKRKVKDEVDTQTPAKKIPKISILDHFSSVSIDRSTDAVLARMIALDGLSFSDFITSKDLRKCLNALGHEIPLSAETIKIKVCRYADTFREKVVRELQMEKEKGQTFSLTLDEWTSIRSKRYLNINIHSRTKVWNLGLTRISGVVSSEQYKYVIGAKLLEFGIDFETDIVCVTTDGCAMMVKLEKKKRVVPEFVSATVNEAESDLSEDGNEDTSPFNVSLEVAHPSFPEAIYPQSPVFSKKYINEVTKKARVVVKLFKRSPLKNEILLNYMRQDNRISTSMCLILDCRTRWDSLLNMLERLLSVKSAIQKTLIDVNANVRLTDEDFAIMTQVISALKPFRAAVAAICRRDATLLTAEATVKFILEELQAQSHSLSKDLQKYFQKRILEERCNKTSLVLQYLHNPQAQLEKKKMVKDFSVKLLLRLKPLQEQMAEVRIQADNSQLPRSLQERHEPLQSNDHLTIERRLQEAIEAASSTSIAIPTPDFASYSTMTNHELNIAAQSGKRGPHLESVYQYLLTIPPTETSYCLPGFGGGQGVVNPTPPIEQFLAQQGFWERGDELKYASLEHPTHALLNSGPEIWLANPSFEDSHSGDIH